MQPDEPSFYFYEDDETELSALIEICEPILNELEGQIRKFNQYNKMEEFMVDKEYESITISREELGGHPWMKMKKQTTRPDPDLAKKVKELLGVKRIEDWVLNLNIGNVMHLSPLTTQEMNLHLDNSHELT